jgi:hypothetical protein
MKTSDLILAEAIKDVLVKMALDCTLEKLGLYISFDTLEELEEAYDKLKNCADSNKDDLADNHIQMCQTFEYDFTMGELWNEVEFTKF